MKAPRRRGEWVAGDLYELRAPCELLSLLDLYEAGATGRERPRFVRVRATVLVKGGRKRSAWLYLYRPPVRPQTRIRCGDYADHLGGTYLRA
jgi:gamma-glutamylcyclotransferase (GGCT)/AIG2-like uncharacterized protein YtfP